MNPPRPLHGLVLAGGRSSRMGTDKAALVHPDGRPLARRAHDLLVEAGCVEVMLSLRRDQPVPAGFEDLADVAIVRDPESGSAGPLAGIIAAMGRMPDADWLVLACDLPRLDVETLRHLISSKRPDEMFLSYRSEFDGLPEPLCALYAPAALPLLRDTEFRCPRKVLIRHDCRLLEPVTSRALDNANTPEDWQTANVP
jgi:molybdopterin-guanine dinucleotide biosynthesis protein A